MDPLTDTHYREINTALNRIARQRAILDKEEAAGRDVSEKRAILDIYEERFNGIKREFFNDKT